VWAQSASDGCRGNAVGTHLSPASTLVNHLAICDYQRAETKLRVTSDPSCTLAGAKSRRLSEAQNVNPSLSIPYQPPSMALPPYPPHHSDFASPLVGSSTIPSPSGLYYPESESPMDHSNSLQLDFGSFPLTPLIVPSLLRCNSESLSSLRPEDLASSISTRRAHSRPPSSRTGTPRLSSSQLWTASNQTEFENHITRITVSANLPLSWVDNPEVATFMDKYVPAATSPSCKVLTKRIIPKLVDELQNAAKNETQGKNVTVQADGWTGGNHRHLVAFMITADKKVQYFYTQSYQVLTRMKKGLYCPST